MPYASKKHRDDRNHERYRRDRRKVLADKKQKYNPKVRKNYLLKRAYGITLETYNRMVTEQGNLCAICGRPESNKQKVFGKPRHNCLCVDHDHTTDKVRQLLCSRCNSILGYANDDVLLLRAIVAYIKRHRSKEDGHGEA